MAGLWSISKALLIPVDPTIESIHDLPHTISYVIRKRSQVDSLLELPKEKRPPDSILWHSNPDLLEDWLDRVMEGKSKKKVHDDRLEISMDDIE
jgi:hypothetical protein